MLKKVLRKVLRKPTQSAKKCSKFGRKVLKVLEISDLEIHTNCMRMYVNTSNTRGCEPFCILPQVVVATITEPVTSQDSIQNHIRITELIESAKLHDRISEESVCTGTCTCTVYTVQYSCILRDAGTGTRVRYWYCTDLGS